MKRNWKLYLLLGGILLAAAFAYWIIVIYSTAFGNNLLPPPQRDEWGALGDFFGGILNPIFSFLALVLLLVTLFQNQYELELSRIELQKSSQALNAQALTLDRQRFEDSFFALLDQLNRLLEKLLADRVRYRSAGQPEGIASIVESLKQYLIDDLLWQQSDTQETNSLPKAKEALLGHDPLLNQYFRLLFQLLKFISTNCPETALGSEFSVRSLEATRASASEKFYSNIVRSCVPENVYYLLAVNCFSKDASDPYRPYALLIERYAFLEHMRLTIPEHQNQKLLRQITSFYKSPAFGSNPDYKPA